MAASEEAACDASPIVRVDGRQWSCAGMLRIESWHGSSAPRSTRATAHAAARSSHVGWTLCALTPMSLSIDSSSSASLRRAQERRSSRAIQYGGVLSAGTRRSRGRPSWSRPAHALHVYSRIPITVPAWVQREQSDQSKARSLGDECRRFDTAVPHTAVGYLCDDTCYRVVSYRVYVPLVLCGAYAGRVGRSRPSWVTALQKHKARNEASYEPLLRNQTIS